MPPLWDESLTCFAITYLKHMLNMFELLYHEKDLLSSLFVYRNCEQQGPGDQELYFPDQGCSIRLQEQARKLAGYWFIIPASQMICQQVFTISSKTANHLANTYALEYIFSGGYLSIHCKNFHRIFLKRWLSSMPGNSEKWAPLCQKMYIATW